MNEKKKLRFLKKIMIYTLIMGTIVTLGTLVIAFMMKEINGSIITPLCAMWSIELSLSAWIKTVEKKESNDEEPKGSI